MSLCSHPDDNCVQFDDDLFIKKLGTDSVVQNISLHGTRYVTPNQANVVPAADSTLFPKYFKAKDSESYSVIDFTSKLNYVASTDKNKVGELFQLPGINHHLFQPSSQVYKDILQSVQDYDPLTPSSLSYWTFPVIESVFRWREIETSEIESASTFNSGYTLLKNVYSLVPLEENNLHAEGKLTTVGHDSTSSETRWNLMEAMHRAVALCQVLRTVEQTHPIHKLRVNVVVHQLAEDGPTKSRKDYQDIIYSITRNSASIRDENHNLTKTSHEGILLMLINTSFDVKEPKPSADTPSSKKRKPKKSKKNKIKVSKNLIKDSMLKFTKSVKARVQEHLPSITNSSLPELTTDDLTCSPFIKREFIKSYFSPTRTRFEGRLPYFTVPRDSKSVKMSDHLITVGRALSMNNGMRVRFSNSLRDLDSIGFLNDSKLGKK
jgi:hypothetical protein